MEEHWRLLYVALTRAEERLVIGGSLGPKSRGMPPEQSWYAKVHLAMERLGIAPEDNPRWGGQRVYCGTEALHPKKAATRASVPQLGRAPCRARVSQYVSSSVVAVSFTPQHNHTDTTMQQNP